MTTDSELEQRLRAFYRAEAGDRLVAPLTLHRDVAAIPRTYPRRASWLGGRRGFTLLAAAALLLVGGGAAAGSGLLRLSAVVLPSPVPTLPVAVVVPARVPSWTATGSMAVARYGHTATLLPNGKVLVAGGVNATGDPNGAALSSAELYDPSTGNWSATGSMAVARGGHTATLLRNGKVLVAGCAGGFGNRTVLASAELYDPATGTWAATGTMVEPRCLHFTATLLLDGRVLVAGGQDKNIVATAELYDPSTGIWAATGSMTGPRYDHTAALLSDGTVLVAGGADHGGGGGIYLATAELYNPAAGTWIATGSLSAPHGGDVAQLLPDGMVLVTGAPSELYDPGTGSWATTGSTTAWYNPAVLLPDGRVVLVGGKCGNAACDQADVSAVEVYLPTSRSWTSAAGSPVARRFGHTASLLPDGTVLVAGGFSNRSGASGSVMASAELYDPGSGQ